MKHRNPVNHNIKSTDQLCEELRELVPLYSVGAVGGEERRFVEKMLPFCPEVANELAEYGALMEGLLHALPQNETPPSVDGLMKRVEQYERTNAQPVIQHPPAPVLSPVAPVPSPVPMRRWSVAAAVLIVLLFTASNVYWARQVELLRAEQQAVIELLQRGETPPEVVLAGNDHHRHLSATNVADDEAASAILIWNSDEQIGTLYANELPPLPENRVYQVWLMREGHHITLGTFKVDENGVGSLVFHSTEPVESFSVIGISTEESVGVDAPTTPHVVTGSI